MHGGRVERRPAVGPVDPVDVRAGSQQALHHWLVAPEGGQGQQAMPIATGLVWILALLQQPAHGLASAAGQR